MGCVNHISNVQVEKLLQFHFRILFIHIDNFTQINPLLFCFHRFISRIKSKTNRRKITRWVGMKNECRRKKQIFAKKIPQPQFWGKRNMQKTHNPRHLIIRKKINKYIRLHNLQNYMKLRIATNQQCIKCAWESFYGPNLAIFEPKILIFTGVSKSFGTHIT